MNEKKSNKTEQQPQKIRKTNVKLFFLHFFIFLIF
jgi:hypothetical protein